MKKVQQDYIKHYIQIVIIFLMAIAACLLVFFYQVEKDVEENVRVTITNNVEKQGDHFQAILEVQYSYLEGIAEFIGDSGDLLSQENMKMLRYVVEKTELERLGIVDSDGWCHYDTGETKCVSFRRYFQEGMAGQKTLSDPLESRVDGTTRVVLGVPICKEDQVIGVLGGSYDVTALSRMIFDDIYEGEGFSLILMTDGTIVSYQDPNSFWGSDTENDFFECYKNNFGNQGSLEKIRDDFEREKSGYVEIFSDGEEYHMAYEPLGYNDWMLCYAVPIKVAKESYQFITDYEIILSVSFVFLVLVFFWNILRINNRKQKELIRSANTDSLTGLSNKKSTEDLIQEWLENKQDQMSGIQAFFIMDIDYFKEINDRYGHAVGDEVLRQIGGCLRGLFRSHDVMGRIGGDEFVVFMKNVPTVLIAEKKAEELSERVRQIEIPEMQGKRVTTSIGVSYAPDHGKGYLDLYKHADMALYETKEKGRNGYTICESDNRETSKDNYVHKAYTEINPLTGLYYNKAFFRKVDEYLKTKQNQAYMLVAIDIEHFRLFNRLYGRKAGDQLLIYIAECLKNQQEKQQGIAGYVSGDNFCILLPRQKEVFLQIQNDIKKRVEGWSRSIAFLPGFGVYEIDDTSVPAVVMYDRATMALSHVYGNFGSRVCVYDPKMEQKMEEEISIVSEVQEGLKNQEFLFYIQPQCHISKSGIRIVGGECLVRWQHKQRGLVSPDGFIPVLEKNGFVAELDRYIWKKVCEWLKSWIERGNTPLPMSVNVSRIDIFSMDVPKYLKELISQYQISPRLLKIEIMESTYAEEDERIRKAVMELCAAGFSVMMDDFGSGYSSLNMLKSVAVDVLKLDARFLEFGGQEEKKGIDILESMIGMSRQMGLPIIVEGVEREEQERCLLSIGCRYVQGFYYYHPMPVEEFEQLISNPDVLDLAGFTAGQVNNVKLREFLDINIITDNMLNHMLGPSAFYEIFHNRMEITSVNDQYCKMSGNDCNETIQRGARFWNHVVDDERKDLLMIFQKAFENPEEGASGFVHYQRSDGKVLLTHLRVCFIREREEHRIFYGSLTDVTALEREKQTKEIILKPEKTDSEEDGASMEKYYGGLPCGLGIGKVNLDEDGKPEEWKIIYVNQKIGRMYKKNVEQLTEDLEKLFFKNREEFLQQCYRAAYQEKTSHFQGYTSISCKYLSLTIYPYKQGYAGVMVEDITEKRVNEEAMHSIAKGFQEIYFIHLEDNHYRMIYPDPKNALERGNYEEAVNRHFVTRKIVEDQEGRLRRMLSIENIRETLTSRKIMELHYRREGEEGEIERCRAVITSGERRDGIPITAILFIRNME